MVSIISSTKISLLFGYIVLCKFRSYILYRYTVFKTYASHCESIIISSKNC